MEDIRFEWDLNKAERNQVKHGISFEEAATAFYDNRAQLYLDPEHSDSEERYILLGMTIERALCVVVCHCYRDGGEVIRLISARKATRFEEKEYSKSVKGGDYERRI